MDLSFKMICKKQVLAILAFLIVAGSSTGQETTESKAEFESIIKQFQNSKTALQKIKSQTLLLGYYRRLRDFNTADSILKSGISIAEKDGDKLAAVYTHLNYFTTTYFALPSDKKEEMMSQMQTALKLAEDGNFKNEETLILSRIGYKYAFYDYNFEKAISYFNKADLNDEKVSDSARSDFYYHKSAYYSVKKENLDMFKCSLSLLKYAEKCQSVYYMSRAYRTLGVFYKSINNFEKAMAWHEKELALHMSKQDKRSINNISFMIARDYRDWGKNNEAIDKYNSVINESIRLNDRFNKDLATVELLNLYLKLGKIKQADTLNQKYQLIERHLINKDYLRYNWNKAQYFSFFNKDSAKYYYNKALLSVDSSTGLNTKIDLYTILINVFNRSGEPKKAVEIAQEALAMNNELKLLANYPDIYEEMDSAYQSLGDFKNAYAARQQYTLYKDSLDALNDKTEALRIEINTTEENQKKLEEEELKAIAKKHNIQYAAITIGGLVLMIAMLSLSFFHTPKWLVRVLGFVSFIFLFEFLILILDTKLHHWAHGAPLPILLIKIAIACLLVPLHHWLEHKVISFLHSKKFQVKTVKKENA